MINYKKPGDIKKLETAGKILAELLHLLSQSAQPGVSTGELEKQAVSFMKKNKVKSLFKGHQGYPAVTCLSINDEIVHSIPDDKKVLKSGDILGIDSGLWYKGVCVDAAVTVGVGELEPQNLKLLEVTKEALNLGIQAARAGNHIGDIGQAIETYVKSAGLAVVRGLVGHGVGFDLWEEPQVPNYGSKGEGLELKPGLVIAIEPMVTTGGHEIKTLEDGWTIVTSDGSLAAQFEHTIAITQNGPLVLTNL